MANSHEHSPTINKRKFLKIFSAGVISIFIYLLKPMSFISGWLRGNSFKNKGLSLAMSSEDLKQDSAKRANLGVEKDGRSKVYLVQGKSPENNINNILEMMGGIERFIGREDIVILKPNAQWWNQGMTNTNAMKAFIEAVLKIRGFHGEIVIAENHQYANSNSRAWTTDMRNGDYNYNELVEYFQAKGYRNVTKYHWCCAGPNPNPIEGDEALCSKIVKGPWQGDGYVWRDDLIYASSLNKKCMMTYPIFTSSYSGVTIDFKKGAWKDGKYTGQPVKFINFSALNHHEPYCGVTASVKNYMGIVDMTCGYQGSTPKGFHNTHFIGLRNLIVPFYKHMPWRIRNVVDQYNMEYFHHTGTVLGRFMRKIRMADLNIITAHWVGYGSRIRTKFSGYPKAIIASTDPVALDYVACQEILYPLTKEKTQSESLIRLHNVTNKQGPFYRFLEACHKEKIGNIDPKKHVVVKA